ncbi:MAG TPA: hypothetical protein VFV66_28540 [Nonomuraea sp.]|nr:hypothetical protein [Nonomuraea sp.]
MAVIPNPRTWGATEGVTAAKLNADIRDALNFYLAPPLARLRKSGTQSVPNNSVTAVTWDVEVIDRDGGHSNVTNPSRYTAQTAGWYHLRAGIVWSGSRNTGWQDLYFRKNGIGTTLQNRSVWVSHEDLFLNDSPHITEGYMSLGVGDYVEVVTIIQNSPAPVNITNNITSWEIRWVAA